MSPPYARDFCNARHCQINLMYNKLKYGCDYMFALTFSITYSVFINLKCCCEVLQGINQAKKASLLWHKKKRKTKKVKYGNEVEKRIAETIR